MAASPIEIQFRSISLPSRLHPIKEPTSNLQKLNSSLSKHAPITSQTIHSSLLALADLYNSVDKNHRDPKSIEHSLDLSVALLDSCEAIRELAQSTRENARALQSALRRAGPAMQGVVNSYFCSRKKANKRIAKGLKELESLENKSGSNFVSMSDRAVIDILRRILVFLSGPGGKSGGWNLISRMMVVKSVERVNEIGGEVGFVDYVLGGFRNGDLKGFDVKIVERSLQNVDDCVEGIEAGLQRLFRQLLQNRVRLLNLVTDY